MKKAFAAWGVTDKESLLSRVQWLLEDGLREEYKKLHMSLAARNEVSRKRYVESSVDHPDHAKIVIVNAFLQQLLEKLRRSAGLGPSICAIWELPTAT